MCSISKKTGLQAGAMVAVAAAGFGLISFSGQEQAQANSPAAYSVKGFDTSHHNSHPVRWSAAVRAGYSFVFQKATQGTGYRDPKFSGDFAGASRAGLMAAAYHFYDTGTGAAQADHFIRTVKAAGYDGKLPGQLPPVVDLEKIRGRCPSGVNNTQVADFLTKTRQAFGVNPIVYTSKDFADTCLRGNTGVRLRRERSCLSRHDRGTERERGSEGGAR
ncbi:glycoside hydrolase family 25 protein [Streptomyces sp. NPDC001880]